jgi:hypothetical protein
MKYTENRTETRREDWGTPQWLYDFLDQIFIFEIDLAASKQNTKHKEFYGPKQDFFRQEPDFRMGWCNPPYGRIHNQIWPERLMMQPNVVVLHQASVGAKWFDAFWKHADALVFLDRRLKFEGASNVAQFDSVLVVKISPSGMKDFYRLEDLKKLGTVVTKWSKK